MLPQLAIVARLMRAARIVCTPTISNGGALGFPIFQSSLNTQCAEPCCQLSPMPAHRRALTGSVIVETIFHSRHGVTCRGALNRDYTLVMGTVVLIAVFTVLFNHRGHSLRR
jgi:oligopeptide transport system permease protein